MGDLCQKERYSSTYNSKISELHIYVKIIVLKHAEGSKVTAVL